MLMRRFAIKLPVLLALITLSSCLSTHRLSPDPTVGATAPTKTYAKVYYHVDDQVLGLSRLALVNALREKSPFQESQAVDEAPAQGVFVNVGIKDVPMGKSARFYRTVSLATLTVLPAWSGRGGSDILYEVYVDGQKMKNFDYQIRRKQMIWLPLLTVAWVNPLLRNEGEAFEATALQFFDDADSFFRTASTPAP